VRVLPSTTQAVATVSDDVKQFRQSKQTLAKATRPAFLTFASEHLYGDRLKRVDERTLSRRRGPLAQFSVPKK
jgi:hypothetical protein